MNFDGYGDEPVFEEEELTFPSPDFANYMAQNSIYSDDWDRFVDNQKNHQKTYRTDQPYTDPGGEMNDILEFSCDGM